MSSWQYVRLTGRWCRLAVKGVRNIWKKHDLFFVLSSSFGYCIVAWLIDHDWRPPLSCWLVVSGIALGSTHSTGIWIVFPRGKFHIALLSEACNSCLLYVCTPMSKEELQYQLSSTECLRQLACQQFLVAKNSKLLLSRRKNVKLTKCKVDQMPHLQCVKWNVKLTKCLIFNTLTKCQVDKMSTQQNANLTKCHSTKNTFSGPSLWLLSLFLWLATNGFVDLSRIHLQC